MKTPSIQFLIILLASPIILFAQNHEVQDTKIEQTNLLFIEGGTFNMGQDAENDIVRRVTVSSFYIDATEVSNKEYRNFVNDLKKQDPKKSKEMLPDTSIWIRCIEPVLGAKLAKDYFRMPAFDYYPVVGVSWVQAWAFITWKSDRQNEELAIKNGCWTSEFQEKYNFSTKEFVAGNYHKKEGKEFPECLNTLYPNYRLLSEAEWELAAWAMIGERELTSEGRVRNQVFNPLVTEGKDRHHKKAVDKYRKLALQHARKHPLPSYYEIEKYNLPKSIFEGAINQYGIYNLNHNVSEWVQDAYRPISKTVTVAPNTPAPNVERGTNVETVPADKMNDMDESWDEVLANGEAAEKSRVNATKGLKVFKGTSGKSKKSPGDRYGAKASGQQERLIGFRCGMTRILPPSSKEWFTR
jgi:formylglycine-generating enzyme required for sulfatase activity